MNCHFDLGFYVSEEVGDFLEKIIKISKTVYHSGATTRPLPRDRGGETPQKLIKSYH